MSENSFAQLMYTAAKDNADHCVVCHREIETMVYRGTGVCGELHRKFRDDVPMGDLITSKGWYHTCAKNLVNHIDHDVRFSLSDPFQIIEGRIGQVVSGDDLDDLIEVHLHGGWKSWAPPPIEPEVKVYERQMQTAFTPFKVVEVRRCK